MLAAYRERNQEEMAKLASWQAGKLAGNKVDIGYDGHEDLVCPLCEREIEREEERVGDCRRRRAGCYPLVLYADFPAPHHIHNVCPYRVRRGANGQPAGVRGRERDGAQRRDMTRRRFIDDFILSQLESFWCQNCPEKSMFLPWKARRVLIFFFFCHFSPITLCLFSKISCLHVDQD